MTAVEEMCRHFYNKYTQLETMFVGSMLCELDPSYASFVSCLIARSRVLSNQTSLMKHVLPGTALPTVGFIVYR